MIKRLLKKLPNAKVWGALKKNLTVLDLRLLPSDQFVLLPNTVYLTSTKNLPKPPQLTPTIIFCYGPAINFAAYGQVNAQIIYCPHLSQVQLFNLLSDILMADVRLNQQRIALNSVLFANQGLQALIDFAAQLFNNPVAVIDLQYKHLATSADFTAQSSQSQYIDAPGIHYIHKSHLTERIRDHSTPIQFFNDHLQTEVMVSAVKIDNIEVAHLIVTQTNQAFRATDLELLAYLAQLVANELQKDAVFANNKGVMYSYFLADLLSGTSTNTQDFTEFLAKQGFLLKPNLYVMVIPSGAYNNSSLSLNVIATTIHKLLAGSIFAVYKNSIVFLISKEAYHELSDYELANLKQFLTAQHLKAGISNFFTHLENTPIFYRQAVTAVRLGQNLHDPAVLFYYKDYYIFQILELLKKESGKLEYLIHPGVMLVYKYDLENQTDLLTTLREFLAHPGQPKIIADHLHIHKNTLLYRLKKIKQITNCDFTSGQDYMNCNFSLRIMMYLGMLPELSSNDSKFL